MNTKLFGKMAIILVVTVLVISTAVFAAGANLKPKFALERFKMKLGDIQSISGFLSAPNFDIDNFSTSNDSVVKIINSKEVKAVSTGASTLSYKFVSGGKDVVIYCDVEVTRDYSTFSAVGAEAAERIYIKLMLGDYVVTVEGKGGAVPSLPQVENGDLYFEGWYKEPELTTKLGEKERLHADTTLYPKWITEEEKNYKEVVPSDLYTDITYHWGRTAIESVTYLELFKGVSDTEFGPDLPMTRGMAVTVLGRMDKADVTGLKSTATDAKEGSYYDGYLAWAVENKLVELEGGKFRPEDSITREEMAVMMANYIKFKNYKYTVEEVDFSDKASISVDALDSVRMLNTLKIMQGNADGTYAPKSATTRAQIAQIFYNYYNYVNKL